MMFQVRTLCILATYLLLECQLMPEANASPPVVPKDSTELILGIFIGGALPSYDAPQGPNVVGAYLSNRFWPDISVGVDVSFAGTTQKALTGRRYDLASSLYGISATYHLTKWLQFSIQPTLHRVSYSIASHLNSDGPFIATIYQLKPAVGMGLRVAGFMLDPWYFPAVGETALPDGSEVNSTLLQIRLGYCFDLR